jgi:hypothetical protein
MTNPTFERAVSYLRLEEHRLLKLHACVPHTALAAGLGYGAPAPPVPTPPAARPPAPFAAPPPPPQQQQQGRHRRGRGCGGRTNGGYAGGGPPPANQMHPWSGGFNPWTGVVHTYTMPVPRPPPRPQHPWPSSAGSSGPLRRAAAALRAGLRRHAVLRALPAGRLGPRARRCSSAGCSCGFFWWRDVAHGL